jgi:hypothetical protein
LTCKLRDTGLSAEVDKVLLARLRQPKIKIL